ncbi:MULTISPECIES: hypothetical protein [Sinorhizobium]|uniref:hypothetical protein n=1 Tax=Sinorhizobium TaxID=28105 RepID=UPI000BEAC7C1|nr:MULTISPECIES: hypothetical protein [Sinorhizobium]PDT50841.1 hypothetical protein CO664_24045 [Sinorhizobium sp. NG07B]POH24961.1 hypothetical protein ATY30_28350 [Sinorhizobium americanum]
MPTEQDLAELTSLLNDAKLIASYSQRAGRLRNAELLDAIRTYENLTVKTWGASETVALQQAVNQAIGQLHPISLLDLRRNNPFDEQTTGDSVRRYVLIAASILLMAITAYFTVLYNRGTELVSLVEKINGDHPAEKMAAVAREWRSAKFDSDKNSAETYYKMLDELRQLDFQVKDYLAQYRSYTEALPIVGATPAMASSHSDGSRTISQDKLPEIPCGESEAEPVGKLVAEFLQKPPGSILGENKKLIVNFACAEGFIISPYSLPYLASLGADIKEAISIMGMWVLPGLYGALGALVFYMRSILNPVLPDPPIEKIAHRVALGGFAGIIFAWFWAPQPSDLERFVGLSVNSFAFAFIIGFSIDVFFALLDRLVTSVQGLVSEPPQGSSNTGA